MSNETSLALESAVIAALTRDRIPTESEIFALATAMRVVPAFSISDEEFSALIKRLHTRLRVDMDTGTAVYEDFQSWLPGRKPEIDPYYWMRYGDYLKRNGWGPRVVGKLDLVTDEILDLLGDPFREEQWRRRGLVMGDVQSGKTATYTALACKAADAGYRLIILLTGTLESLRRQTQERLDAGFVGRDSSGLLSRERTNREVGVGLIDRRRFAGVFTSRSNDFRSALMNQLGFRLKDFREPVLLVVKKNKRILENLENWLRAYNAEGGGLIDTPMLLIDDEADNASVNTNISTQDPTAINTRIRSLLRLFTRTGYVGFTATPFANIFIDPDTEDDMRGNDLFPRDFIYALEAPTNYVGARTIFSEDAEIDCLREIYDAETLLPPTHRSSFEVVELPASLDEALRTFIVANALRDLRGEGLSHRSMLVNVSRFTAVQDQVSAILDHDLRQMQQDIRNYSQLPPEDACRNQTLSSLRDTWGRQYPDTEFPWETVQKALQRAALPIIVKSVNQRTGAASLDFAAHRDNGLRVVAVGGNSLSRGLTLEGLCVSYFYRNSQMYDTLLQMGRWFGYRDGYADLCRIWLCDEAMQWYAHIALATDELREEIRRMRAADLTPKDFGLKVRSHPDSLLVTARNKMRTATEIERVISVSGQGLETPKLRSDTDTIRVNAESIRDFIADLMAAGISYQSSDWGNTIWRNVPKAHVAALLRKFSSHPLDFAFQHDFLSDFLDATDEQSLTHWDVVIPNGKGNETSFAGIVYRPQKRKVSVNSTTRAVLVSGRSARVGSRGIEKEGIPYDDARRIEHEYKENNEGKSVPDSEFRRNRTRPLLLIHLLTPEGDNFNPGGFPLAALGLSFPEFDDSNVARRIRYRINLVELRNMFEFETDDEAEEEDDAA